MPVRDRQDWFEGLEAELVGRAGNRGSAVEARRRHGGGPVAPRLTPPSGPLPSPGPPRSIRQRHHLQSARRGAVSERQYGIRHLAPHRTTKLIVGYDSATAAPLYSTTLASSNQAKSIATDDRGYVYLGTGLTL